MSTKWTDKAKQFAERLMQGVRPQARAVEREGSATWYPSLMRTLSEHELSILEPGGDLVVYFDAAGQMIGWRDDGRLGSAAELDLGRDTTAQLAIRELELPAGTRAGDCRTAVLEPLGYTMEIVLFPPPGGPPADLVRAWIAPQSQKVIQVLWGVAAGPGVFSR